MLNGKPGLAENIRKGTFREGTMLRNNGPKNLTVGPFFERNMAALLPQLDKTSSFERAHEALSRNTRQLWHLPCDFYDCPEGLLFRSGVFRATPSFQMKFDGFAQIRPSRFDVLALRRDVEFGASRDIQPVFFGNERRESVRHTRMLAELNVGRNPKRSNQLAQ